MQHLSACFRQGKRGEEEHAIGGDREDRDRIGQRGRGRERADQERKQGADAAAGRHTYPAVLGVEGSRARARELVDEALGAVKALEPTPGPLAALARYSVERST